MAELEIGSFISYLGLLIQAAGAAVLLFLFLLLRSHTQRRDYFVTWGNAWLGLTIGLTALVAVFGSRADAEWWVVPAHLLYVYGKACFFALLLVGTLMYARGFTRRLPWWLPYAGAAVFTLPSLMFPLRLDLLVLWQTPLAILTTGACAFLLLNLPASRRTLGSRATGISFALLAVLWALYSLAFPFSVSPALALPTTAPAVLAAYNSYFDLLLQTLLAFGMVLILLEDAKRETDAAHAELALAHDKLLSESYRDALTGAFNRRAYTEGIGLEAARTTWGTVVMVDLDNLKHVNDGHGHAAGDDVLKHLVAELRLNLRPTDMLYRMGGDEFLIVMPRSRAEAVAPRLDLLLQQAPRLKVADRARGLRLKVSLGAADYTDQATIPAAVKLADQRMYEVKRRHKETGELDTDPRGQVS